MKIIDEQKLSRRFERREAVKGVSFQVAEGEIFGLPGPNGAGKSTTINMLCTLLRPTGGTATVNGHDVVRNRSEVRRSIGLVFQQPTLDEQLSAQQNLRFHAYAYGITGDLREERMRELLEMVERVGSRPPCRLELGVQSTGVASNEGGRPADDRPPVVPQQ
jgi:ABC-2 type transport system ATP-binding protein